MRNYLFGLIASLALTGASFLVVVAHLINNHEVPSHAMAAMALVVFALLQFFAQSYYFLHLGERKNAFNLQLFAFALVVVAIVVGGTLWIMTHLSHGQPQTPFEGEVTAAAQYE